MEWERKLEHVAGTGTVAKNVLKTSSLSSTQKEYYYNLQHSSTDHFTVSYGHIGGSGSNSDGANEVAIFTTSGGDDYLFVQGGTAGTSDDSIISLGDLSGGSLNNAKKIYLTPKAGLTGSKWELLFNMWSCLEAGISRRSCKALL